MPGFYEFYDFETAVLAAVERGDVAAACEMVLAADEFPRVVKRLPTLPEDVRRRLAHDCVELYGAAEGPERRGRILTMHAGLLARRLDLLETDGFEDAVMATMHIGASAHNEKIAVLETALASDEFPEMVERLRPFDSEYRRRITENVLPDMHRKSEAPERRERILWMHAALSDRARFVEEEKARAFVREVVERVAPTEGEIAFGKDSLTSVRRELAGLPRDVRRRLGRYCGELLEAAETQERRELGVWLRAVLESGPLAYFGYEEMEPVLKAAVERGDVAAACEMVISDKEEYATSEKLRVLSEDVRTQMVEELAGLYESAASARRRDRVLRVHALLSMSLEKPDDRLASARQEALNFAPRDVYGITFNVEMAWVELASGRDIPVDLGAVIRRFDSEKWSFKASELRKVVRLLAELHPPLNPGQPWTDRVLTELADLPGAWRDLVGHTATVTKSRPDTAWERKGRALLAEVDAEEFRNRALSWLALVGGLRTWSDFDAYNYQATCGLVWLLSLLPEHPHTVRGLGAALEKALRKTPGIGPGLPRIANACANALCAMKSEAALAEVSRLTTRVTYKTTLKLLQAGLQARAQALGLGRDGIEELAVPTYGLTEVGLRVEDFGGVRAELVVDNGRVQLRWHSAQGRAVKSVPAAVRRDHPEELKELKAEAKAANAMLTAVAKRLDRQFLTNREWPFAAWRERYLDHPLVGTLARRLIWTVDGTACRYTDGALRNVSGEPVAVRDTVRLWHPVGRPVEEVMAWREQLEQEGRTQPFKQAHREVYLLTDAERRTGTYSNRFAGHILRQYPFRSLAAERGWRDPELRICHHDCYYPPAMRELPEWGIRAEYWVRGEGAIDDAWTTDSGAYELLAADQVRFYPIDAPQNQVGTMGDDGFSMHGAVKVAPLPVEEIPEMVLSEVLRDVDLFVGVTSVGNDPMWQDGGPEGRYQEYWSSYSFGALSETARIRHDLLPRLLPRLAVGDRCHVEGRFLHVKGDLNTYRIHLGSGNILMDPGDRYLCIVPANLSEASPEGYLPFDGDRVLSLILSKALMLADDTRITDPTILSQL